jgi:hypothetical protein
VIRSTLAVLALAFALAHTPYIVSTLEDIDSVNFALGIRDFEISDHRPHPPGYPIYVALGKIGVLVTRSVVDAQAPASAVEATTLSVLSLIGALIAIVLLYRLFGTLSATAAQAGGDVVTPPWRYFNPTALAATALTATAPLFWYLAVRPMSDVPGLASALAAQACLGLAWWRQQPDPTGDRRLNPTRMAASGRMIVLGALLAAVSVGFRSQNAILTLPFLLGVLVDRIGRGFGGAAIGASVALVVGTLLWAVPLVAASGGADAYLAALGSQAGEDFAGVQMLYLDPTSPRLVAFALLRTLIHPWDSVLLGSAITALAAAGIVALAVYDRRSLVALALLAFPYLVFHLLFHDTTFVRYALPLVPATVLLAVRGAEFVARRAALPVIGAAALWAVSIAAPVLAAYGSEPSPVARVLAAMRAERAAAPGALALHQTFRRPLQAETFDVAAILPSPPRREWLELAKYWRAGHTAPLWFLADPRRTDLELVDPRSRSDHVDFAWGFQSLSNLGGMRPSAVNWYRIGPPGWFAGEGWALTPETAGIANLMGRGPSQAPITAWVRRRSAPVHVLVGGRHLGASEDPAVRFVMAVDGSDIREWESRPGFFLQTFDVPAPVLAGEGLAELTIRAISRQGGRIPTAIEQFDLQNQDALLWGYDDGWQEAETNAELGVWRWMSERATLRIVGASSPLVLTMRVERPRKYFDDDPIVRMTAGDELLGQTTFAAGDTWTVRIPLEALLRDWST